MNLMVIIRRYLAIIVSVLSTENTDFRNNNNAPSGENLTAFDGEYLQQDEWRSTEKPEPFKIKDFPQPGQCGTQMQTDLTLSIFGGHNTTIFEYPWMALLEYRTNLGNSFFCGGAIINKNYILTAAHCISGPRIRYKRAKVFSVRLGEHNLATNPDCEPLNNGGTICAPPAVDISIAEKIVHEKYKMYSSSSHDDIALIRVAQSINFTEWVKPICLPIARELRNKNFNGKRLIVAGFGQTEKFLYSDVMLQVGVNGTSDQLCKNIFKKFPYNYDIIPKQLCAGGQENEDTCHGDSGGPLMYRTSKNGTAYTYIAGIVSIGFKCGKKGVPGVYTRVNQYIDWIVQHMRH